MAKEYADPQQGTRLYTLSAVKIEKPASLRGNAAEEKNSSRLSHPPASFDDRFAQLVDIVKGNKGEKYSP